MVSNEGGPSAARGANLRASAPPTTFDAFLKTTPPLRSVECQLSIRFDGAMRAVAQLPRAQLRCEGECDSERGFDPQPEHVHVSKHLLIPYSCRDCGEFERLFAVRLEAIRPITDAKGIVIGHVYRTVKFGEWPAYGDPVPSRVIDLLKPHDEAFLKGRRCENQSLGVAAFAYYRLVVESSFQALLLQIRSAAERLGSSPEVLAALDGAAKDHQFKSAAERVKNAIPASLLVGGRNPITVLHDCLSVGLHGGDDDACLTRAVMVRTVLVALAERMKTALAEHAAVEAAVSKLASTRSSPRRPPTAGEGAATA